MNRVANVPSEFASRNVRHVMIPRVKCDLSLGWLRTLSCTVFSRRTSYLARVDPLHVPTCLGQDSVWVFFPSAHPCSPCSGFPFITETHQHSGCRALPTGCRYYAGWTPCCSSRSGLPCPSGSNHFSSQCLGCSTYIPPHSVRPSHCSPIKGCTSRYFYALELEFTFKQVTDSCHHCVSLRTLPKVVYPQTTSDTPDVVGVSFAADVLKRSRSNSSSAKQSPNSQPPHSQPLASFRMRRKRPCTLRFFSYAWSWDLLMAHRQLFTLSLPLACLPFAMIALR